MTRRRSRRILGMTVAQLFILACMGLALCGTLGTGVWMLSSAYGVAIAWPTRVVPPTALIIPTSTSIPTVTLTPEPTLTPTATPIPYEGYVPAGWKQYKTDKVEIWLPDTFAFVDDPNGFNQELTTKYPQIGLGDLAKERIKELEGCELIFRYGPPISNGYIPIVFVKEIPRNGLTLSQYIDKTITSPETNTILVERKPFDFYHAKGERVIVQTNYNNIYISFVYYFVTDGNNIWEIGSDANLDNFYTFLPTFDDITRTFRSVKP